MAERHVSLLAWLAVVGLPSVAFAQPVGPEFRVNTETLGVQQRPSVASDANGNFIVVWNGFRGVSGQRYDVDGNRMGGEFRVNELGAGDASVASDPNGNFVIVWGTSHLIYGQRYDSGGHRLGGNFQVNTQTESFVSVGGVASDASGNFTVVWSSADGDSNGVSGRRFDSNGTPLGGEFQVNTYTTYSQAGPSVASDASGNFVVAWQSNTQDGNRYGIFGQRYDGGGNPLGEEFQVNTVTIGKQTGPSVASDPNGNFVVVWTTNLSTVFGQRYDSDGNPLGNEFLVSTYVFGDQRIPVVSSDASGNFVVVWENYYYYSNYRRAQSRALIRRSREVEQHPSGVRAASFADRRVDLLVDLYGIYGQRFDSDGNRIGPYFQVNTSEGGLQNNADVSLDATGNFLVVWESSVAGEHDIYGQRFSGNCEASVQVGGVHAPGDAVFVQIHIAHHRPKTITVPWELRLIDSSGRVVLKRTTEPHTFEPGDVVDREVQLQLPNDLASGTYALELAISGMAGTKGATTTLQVVRAE